VAASFPRSLPEFQRVFPDDVACQGYLEDLRWPDGFVYPTCHHRDEPYRFGTRSSVVLRCRACKTNASLTAGTVMQSSHTKLSTWFWGAYLMMTHTPGISSVQFQRQLGIKRNQTAFQILHKLRSATVRPERNMIGSEWPVEIDECFVGGATRGEGEGVHHKTVVVGAVEVRTRDGGGRANARAHTKRRLYAGRLRLAVAADRSAKSLVPFVTANVVRGARVKTDAADAYNDLCEVHGYNHDGHGHARRPQGRREAPANHPPGVLEPEDVALRDASRSRRAATPASVPQRVRVPVQPALVPDDGLQLRFGDFRADGVADLRRALLGEVEASFVMKAPFVKNS